MKRIKIDIYRNCAKGFTIVAHGIEDGKFFNGYAYRACGVKLTPSDPLVASNLILQLPDDVILEDEHG